MEKPGKTAQMSPFAVLPGTRWPSCCAGCAASQMVPSPAAKHSGRHGYPQARCAVDSTWRGEAEANQVKASV